MDQHDRWMLLGAGLVSAIVTGTFCVAYFIPIFAPELKPDPDLKGALTLAFGGVIGFWTGPLATKAKSLLQ